MWFSKTLKRLQTLANGGGRTEKEIYVPYGRHSYGPQPEMVGDLRIILQKARGTKVGNFCSIAPGLKFTFLGRRRLEWVSTYPFYGFYDQWKTSWPPIYQNGAMNYAQIPPNPIIIENDVWMASNVTVKEGVRISNGAVVAMDSLVIKDVPPYAFVGGRPARIIKYRFSKEQIEDLLRIAWWNWTDTDIMQAVPLLLSDDIDSFIKMAKKSKNHKIDEA